MKLRCAMWVVLFGVLPLLGQEPGAAGVRFRAMDVFIDSGARPLAAYQLALSSTNAGVKIVGIEGGGHAAFKTPPYYDPQALQREQIVLAAFSTLSATELPAGRTRVATIHVRCPDEATPMFTAVVEAAATSGGQPISVQISLHERSAQ